MEKITVPGATSTKAVKRERFVSSSSKLENVEAKSNNESTSSLRPEKVQLIQQRF